MDRPSPDSPETWTAPGDDPIERVADEYLDRLRRGERPPVEEFTARFPGRAAEIRELISAVLLIEGLKPSPAESTGSHPTLPAPRPGRVRAGEVLGEYRLLREVGRGGMGVVFEAEQASLGRRVALKLLAPWASTTRDQVERFRREARSAAQLHHPNIVPVFGVGEHDGLHYYTMQLIQGQGLDGVLDDVRRLRRPARGGGNRRGADPLATEIARSLASGTFATEDRADSGEAGPDSDGSDSDDSVAGAAAPALPGDGDADSSGSSRAYVRSIARIGVQAASALEYAHGRGMLHRDIKPSNLLLDAEGKAWVTDFGLAKARDDADITRSGDVVGTIRYMAPERFRGRCDARSDVYALGLTLYELLALRPAFRASDRNRLIHQITQSEPAPLRRRDPSLPRDLETIVHKAIEKDPIDRYASAGALADDLNRWLNHQPIRARPSGAAERAVKWARRNPLPAGLAAFSGVAALALLVSLVVGYVRVAESLRGERRASYFQRIALAERWWSDNDVGRAAELLDGCRAELRGWEWHYLNRLCRAEVLDLRVHVGLEPNAVAFHPGGRLLATVGAGGAIALRDVADGTIQARFDGHPGGVHALAFRPDGRRLASAGADGTVQVWELTEGRPVFDPPPRHGGPALLGVAYSPDGTRLATCSGDFWKAGGPNAPPGELTLRDAEDGRVVAVLEGHEGTVHAVAFSPDGTRLASAGGDGRVKLWDTASGAFVRDLGRHAGPAMGVAFRPDGLAVGSAGLDGVVRVWDVAGGRAVLTLREPDDRFFGVAFSPDGRRLAAASRNWVVKLWDAGSGELAATYRGHAREVTGVTFSPDGNRLASAGFGGGVKLWDATRDPRALDLKGAAGAVVALAFRPDGRTVLGADQAGPLRAWDIPSGAGTGLASEDGGGHSAVAYSPDGTWFAAASDGRNAVVLRDAATGRARRTLSGQAGRVAALAISPDGRVLAGGGRDGAVKLWDPATGELRAVFPGTSPVTSLAFRPDGRALAIATGSVPDIAAPGTVTIRDLATRRVLAELPGHNGGISDVAFHPDGRQLATASWDRTVAVWDASTGARLRSYSIRGLLAWAVAYSPDGLRLVAADNIGRLTFWDAESGLEVLTLRGHMDRVYDLAFSPDGRLASASRDGTVRVWDATPLPNPTRLRGE